MGDWVNCSFKEGYGKLKALEKTRKWTLSFEFLDCQNVACAEKRSRTLLSTIFLNMTFAVLNKMTHMTSSYMFKMSALEKLFPYRTHPGST